MPDAAASLRGHLFECQVLGHLCGIRAAHEFPIGGLTDSNQMTWTLCGPIRRINFQTSRALGAITKAVQNREPLHLVPLARNFPAVDSILYDPNDPNAVLTCMQITITLLLSRVFSLSKAGSTRIVHRLEISALAQPGRGTFYLLCRQTWRLLSNCQSWIVTPPGANGLERCINTY